MQRPANFDIDYLHPLAKGLVFAGLGAYAGGNRYFDSSPMRNHGVFVGTNIAWERHYGRMVLAIATAGSYVEIPDHSSIRLGSGDYTMSAIMYFNSSAADPLGALAGKGDTGAGEWMWRNSSGIHFYGNGGSITATKGAANDIWHRVVTTRIGTSAYCFVDGDEELLTGADNSASADLNTTKNLQIGIADTSTSREWAGYIGDFMIWARALHFKELKQLVDPSNVMLSGLIRERGDSHNVYNMEGVR